MTQEYVSFVGVSKEFSRLCSTQVCFSYKNIKSHLQMVIFCEFKATVVRSSFYDEHLSNSRKQNYSCFGLKKKKKKSTSWICVHYFILFMPSKNFICESWHYDNSQRERNTILFLDKNTLLKTRCLDPKCGLKYSLPTLGCFSCRDVFF